MAHRCVISIEHPNATAGVPQRRCRRCWRNYPGTPAGSDDRAKSWLLTAINRPVSLKIIAGFLQQDHKSTKDAILGSSINGRFQLRQHFDLRGDREDAGPLPPINERGRAGASGA